MTITETRWAIAYRRGKSVGLYVGQCLTKKSVIKQHIRDKGLGWYEKDYSRYLPLDPYDAEEIRLGWRYWYRRGDRAVKVRITYDV